MLRRPSVGDFAKPLAVCVSHVDLPSARVTYRHGTPTQLLASPRHEVRSIRTNPAPTSGWNLREQPPLAASGDRASTTELKLSGLEVRVEVLEKLLEREPAPARGRALSAPEEGRPPLEGAERRLERMEVELASSVKQHLDKGLGELEASLGDAVQRHEALLADSAASVEQRLQNLRRELDMRDMLLRCAEELAGIGELMSRSEGRLELLEAKLGLPEPPGRSALVAPSAPMKQAATTAPLPPRSSLRAKGAGPAEHGGGGGRRAGDGAEAQERHVRFTDRAPSSDSTRTPSPRGEYSQL